MASFSVLARYDETLPKGVRLAVVREVQSNEITHLLNQQTAPESYGSSINIDAKALSKIDRADEIFLSDLKKNSPDVYENLTAGAYDFDVKANVKVTGIGLGYGLSSNLTLYSVIPFYRASINVKTKRTAANNYKEMNEIQNENAKATGLVLDLESLPDLDEGIMQSAIVNYYGYNPLGEWQASGLGDIELGFKYRFTSWNRGGALISSGLILPTGREDDPDTIQDIGFGQGFLGTFIESGLGHELKRVTLNFRTRLDYLFKETKEKRAQRSSGDLKREKESYKIKPGIKLTVNPYLEYSLNSWLSLSSGLSYVAKFQDDYQSQNSFNDHILESNSSYSHTVFDLGLELSSVKAYMAKTFIAPLSLTGRFEKVLSGKNTPNITLYSLEARIFF